DDFTAFSNKEKTLLERKRDLQSNLNFQQQLDEYKSVQGYKPIFSGKDKRVIQEKIFSIELKLQKINKSYNELKVRLDHTKQNIQRTNREMDVLLKEHGDVKKDEVFPIDGEQMLEALRSQIEKLSD